MNIALSDSCITTRPVQPGCSTLSSASHDGRHMTVHDDASAPHLTIVAVLYMPDRWFGGWTGMFILNWFIVVSTLVAGLGFGGYASVMGFVRSINQYK